MLGYAVMAGGMLLLWIAATGKADKFFDALKVQLPGPNSGNTIVSTPSSPGELTSGGGANLDSGTHQGIDTDGNIITINKSYANMTDTEKDAANAFAHTFGG